MEGARAEHDTAAATPEGLEPERRCPDCGAKLTVQIFPHGYEAHCTPCERRARFADAAEPVEASE